MAQKQKCPEFENHERWLVSYADMLTLLFAVFVVLFALKKGGSPEVQKAAGAMQESFNTPLEDIPIDRKVGPMEQGYGIFEHFKGEQIRPPLIQKYPSSKTRLKVIDAEMNKVKKDIEDRLYGPNKFRENTKAGEARIVTVNQTAEGFKLSLMARYFYAPGEFKVRKRALKELDDIISILKPLGRDVVVEGHTDTLPADGKLDNWGLSTFRATEIVRYMIDVHHFPQKRLGAVGYADTRPIAHNGTPEGRSLNRRIEFQINYNSEEAATPHVDTP